VSERCIWLLMQMENG